MRDRTTDELLKDAKEALKLCEMCLPVFTDVPGFTHRKEGKDTYVNLAELISELSAKLRESEALISATRGDHMTRVSKKDTTPPKKED